MNHLADLARFECVLIVSALVSAVAFQALTGRVRLAGLLENKTTGAFDPARLQLLVFTALFAGSMLTRLHAMRETHALSLPSDQLFYAVGGGQGIYLVQKYRQSLLGSKGV